MLTFLVGWGLAGLAIFVADKVFEDVRLEGDYATALWVSALYSVLSYLLGWLIFGILGLATLGLGFIFHFVTSLFVGAILIKLVSAMSSKFEARSFGAAFGTSVFLAIASEIAQKI